MASNPFFSQVVRIQTDRGHTVAMGGAYRWVRHPGYTAMILFELGLSALLASWWGLLAGAVCAVILTLRTALEDRDLQAELVGYAAYTQKTRYRLIPWIW
jgi:protein-S-isoprenylcysteine O-methyltransferase Ste14